jgi:hypothetical protein
MSQRFIMPFKSNAQRRKFHILLEKNEISKTVVDEWDKASKGKKLPERVKPKKRGKKTITPIAGTSPKNRG